MPAQIHADEEHRSDGAVAHSGVIVKIQAEYYNDYSTKRGAIRNRLLAGESLQYSTEKLAQRGT